MTNTPKVVKWEYKENVDTEQLTFKSEGFHAEVVDQDGDRSVWVVLRDGVEVAKGDCDSLVPEYHFITARKAAESTLSRYGFDVEGLATKHTPPHPPSLKYKAFTAALNDLCEHYEVVLQVQPIAAHLEVRDSTEFDKDVGTEPTYLANLRDATEDDWRTLGSYGPPADVLIGPTTTYHMQPRDGLGYCPVCHCPGKAREKRPNGDDICVNNHRYPTATAEYPAKGDSNDPA